MLWPNRTDACGRGWGAPPTGGGGESEGDFLMPSPAHHNPSFSLPHLFRGASFILALRCPQGWGRLLCCALPVGRAVVWCGAPKKKEWLYWLNCKPWPTRKKKLTPSFRRFARHGKPSPSQRHKTTCSSKSSHPDGPPQVRVARKTRRRRRLARARMACPGAPTKISSLALALPRLPRAPRPRTPPPCPPPQNECPQHIAAPCVRVLF